MLLELRVENLLLIESAEMRLGPGLNVITGETGAGKTVLAHALDLLLGGKPHNGIVRPGAGEAYVEGLFSLPPELQKSTELAELADLAPDGAAEITLARRVSSEGRTRAYICGRSSSADALFQIGSRLVASFNQHSHHSLLSSTEQMAIVDAHCGAGQLKRLKRYEELYIERSALLSDIHELEQIAKLKERELDLLSYEIDEIERTSPSVEEERELAKCRERLARAEALRQAAAAALDAVMPDGDERGALALTAEALGRLEAVSGADGPLDQLTQRLNALLFEGEEIARELRGYFESLEGDPQRLAEIEERLQCFDNLKRKHGDSIESVLERQRSLIERRDQLEHAEHDLASKESHLVQLQREMSTVAREMSRARKEAASSLSSSVASELDGLGMGKASFEADLMQSEANGSLGPLGIDEVSFKIAANPGVPAGELGQVASGGELSRIMLALLAVAQSKQGRPTLVFDEIDAGVGGKTATTVAKKLRQLATGQGSCQQVICITHLAQIASLAERHFAITKDSSSSPAVASVAALEGEARAEELRRMIGMDGIDGDELGQENQLIAA